jgi:hypothetical protein
MTTADVELTKGGAILRQDGETLRLNNLSHPEYQLSLVSFDPAPLELDRRIKGLKRIDLIVPAWRCKDGKETIKFQLTQSM